MTMVTIGISSVEDAKTRMLAAFQGEAQGQRRSYPRRSYLN